MSLLVALFATALVAACGGDTGSQPVEDGETSEGLLDRPGQVQALAVAGVTAESVTLRFTEVSSGVSQPSSYEIRYRATPMGNNWRSATVARQGTCAYPVSGTAVGATLTCTVAGLEANASYDFRVMAFRRLGWVSLTGGLSNVVTGRTTGDTGGPASIAPVSGSVQIGEVGTPLPQDLVVRVNNSQGAPLAGVTVNWSVSSGGGSVSAATSRTDSNGDARVSRVLGIVVGQNRTTAFVTGLTPLELAADAVAGPPASVTVLPSEVTLGTGETADMQARLADRYGNPVFGANVTWSSSDPNVAVIDSSGRVAARGAGTAGVTATAATAAGVIAASTMTAASPTALAMSSGLAGTSTAPAAAAEGVSTVRVTGGSANYPAEVTRSSGNSQTGVAGQLLSQPFTVVVRNAAGAPLGNVRVTWQITAGGGTLAQSVSTSSSDGRALTRLTLGTTAGSNSVRATVEGLAPVSFSATGTPGPVASISVAPNATSVGVGATLQFTATPRDQYGNAVSTGTPSWSSSSTGVARVNSTGLATGVSPGAVEIRATMNGFTGTGLLGVTATSGPTTNPATVDNLSVASATTSSVTLRFTSVNDGSGNPARYHVRYASTPMGWGWGEATQVASGTCAGQVQGAAIGTTMTCTVTGLSAGNSYDFQLVSYRLNNGGSTVFGNLSNIATGVTGASSPTQSGTLAISPRGGTLTSVGATLRLSVTARSSSGSVISNSGVTWTSSNANVATVSSSGRVTARGLGTAIISVAGTCCTVDQVSVSVTQQISSVSVSPGSVSINQGSGSQLTAVARDANGNTVPGVTFTWSSSNAWVAPVNGSGYVTGSNAGNANIVVSAGGRTASAAVTVAAVSSGGGSGGGGGSSSAWPNRPSGWRSASGSTDFRGGSTGGWGVKHADGSRPAPRPVAISDSPVGSTHEYRFDYPAGHSGGGGPEAYMEIPGSQSVYVGLWVRYSQNWQGHASCINKYLYLATVQPGGAWSAVWYEACGGGASTLHSYQVNQTSGCGGAWRNESVLFERGRWHRVEVIQTVGNPGRVRVWVDGRLATDVSACVSGSGIREATLSGIWGGLGDSVNSSMYWGVAAVEIAVP